MATAGAKSTGHSDAIQSVGSTPGFARWNLEQSYEQRPRKKRKTEESSRLPIKRGGIIERASQQEPQHLHFRREEHDSDNGEVDEDSAVADLDTKVNMKRPKLDHKEEVLQAKEELARLASQISEAPDEHSDLLGSLAQFGQSDNTIVRKLGLGTQLAVYKDIIPGYRIRPLSKKDMEEKLSKEVRRLRNFEQNLLKGYQDYVKALAGLVTETNEGLSSMAMSCVCALIDAVPHFNCRNDLIGVIVNKLLSRETDVDFEKARETLEQVFREDEQGYTSLEAVKQLTKMLKARNYNIHENVLNTFLHLRLLSEFSSKASADSVDKADDEGNDGTRKARKNQFHTKREKKLMRERKEVEKELNEADATVSHEERDKNQAETLKLVFVAYFQILKARRRHLMGACLEGLAKYAHLINQDFFGDVLEALKDLIQPAESSLHMEDDENAAEVSETSKRNVTREGLLCVSTAFALLQGQYDVAKSAGSLHLDLNFFITHLYCTLLPLCQDHDIELGAKSAHLADPNGLRIPMAKNVKVNVATTTVLLLRSLRAVLLPPIATKMVPPVRIAAFTKQILTASLHMPQKSTEATLGLLQQVSKVHGPRIAALWNTEERRGDGVFHALSGEVESSNPFAATIWEGELLKLHFDPKIRDGIKTVEKNIKGSR